MIRFAKKSPTDITVEGRGTKRAVIFTSYAGTVAHREAMPAFHQPGWASWCAFRLLHPAVLCDFEAELSALFEAFKKGDRKWIMYNEEKRALFQRYLAKPYAPGKRK